MKISLKLKIQETLFADDITLQQVRSEGKLQKYLEEQEQLGDINIEVNEQNLQLLSMLRQNKNVKYT